jgi:hypothetical protein
MVTPPAADRSLRRCLCLTTRSRGTENGRNGTRMAQRAQKHLAVRIRQCGQTSVARNEIAAHPGSVLWMGLGMLEQRTLAGVAR